MLQFQDYHYTFKMAGNKGRGGKKGVSPDKKKVVKKPPLKKETKAQKQKTSRDNFKKDNPSSSDDDSEYESCQEEPEPKTKGSSSQEFLDSLDEARMEEEQHEAATESYSAKMEVARQKLLSKTSHSSVEMDRLRTPKNIKHAPPPVAEGISKKPKYDSPTVVITEEQYKQRSQKWTFTKGKGN